MTRLFIFNKKIIKRGFFTRKLFLSTKTTKGFNDTVIYLEYNKKGIFHNFYNFLL